MKPCDSWLEYAGLLLVTLNARNLFRPEVVSAVMGADEIATNFIPVTTATESKQDQEKAEEQLGYGELFLF